MRPTAAHTTQRPDTDTLALFDLDGTLIARDSDHAFGEFMVQLGWADATEHRRRNDAFFAQYQAGTLDVAAYVDFATSAWRARPLDQQQAARRRFMDEVVQPMITPQARALVHQHLDAGHQVAVVTATNEFVTQPIAQAFGVDTLIAVQLQRDAAGLVTGEILGTPSFRDGKIKRVNDWLAGLGQQWSDFAHTVFYSDSTNDLPLLEQVSRPVATNPSPALEAIARQRGWTILRLFE